MEDKAAPREHGAGREIGAELAAVGLAGAEEIGRGGLGVVYRCSQAGLDREVAVKVLIATSEQNRNRFIREQRAMGKLTGHPNIVAVLHVGETASGQPFLVMPYFAEGCLQDRIGLLGALPVDEVLRIAVKLAGALAFAHGFDIVHRDVKPANILITDYGEPALSDFGIAHVSGGFKTAAGGFTGSPAFTAPEILLGEKITPAADIYGLGATLFSGLTGHAAYQRRNDETMVSQFARIAADPLPDLRLYGVNDGVANLVERAMASSPTVRPSAEMLGEMAQQLQAAHGLSVDAMALQSDSPAPSVSDVTGRPLSSAIRVANRIPATLTRCVGRDVAIAQLRGLLATSRLVTLSGVGGVGKTTLATAAADELAGSFADGVWLIELAELADGGLLGEVVARALGLRDQPGQPVSGLLVEFLRNREALLVLDNCEHLIGPVATFVESLLTQCPRLRVLSTSREVLDITGESVMAVEPLAYPSADADPTPSWGWSYSAVELFVERAQAAVPGFMLTQHNAAAVGEICARLDGLPLALELAASRLRAMSVEQIAQALSDRYAILTRGRRGAPQRQQSLEFCVQWSYNLCTAAEKQLWAQLSIFAGTFDLAAAGHVCGVSTPSETLLDDLCSMVDKSIVARDDIDGEVRFRMLDTLRAYGLALLSPAEHSVLRRRHAGWYQRMLVDAESEWFSENQIRWFHRLSRETSNIREAMQYYLTASPENALLMAASMRPMWIVRGMLSEGRRWLDMALAANPHTPTPQRVRALCASAHISALAGDAPNAVVRVGEVREALFQSPDRGLQADVDSTEAYAALLTGDLTGARHLCERALAAATDVETTALTMSYLGWIAQACGDTDESVRWLDKMLAATESLGESHLRARALLSAGGHWLYRDHLQNAERALSGALRHSAALEDRWTGELCLQLLAWVAGANGDVQRATLLAAAAESLRRSTGADFVLIPRRGFTLIDRARAFHAGVEDRARKALGMEAFEATRREGLALTFHEAVAVALDDGGQAGDPQCVDN
jgi:predicted ATPase